MPKREAAHTIVLHRQGKRIAVKPGQIADLTDAELADINKRAPEALKKLAAPVESNEVKLPPADTAKSQRQGKGKHDEKPADTPAAAAADDEI